MAQRWGFVGVFENGGLEGKGSDDGCSRRREAEEAGSFVPRAVSDAHDVPPSLSSLSFFRLRAYISQLSSP